MAEYQDRERNYNNGLGKVLGGFIQACVDGDSEAKDAYVDRQIRLMSQEKPNAEFQAEVTLIGMKQSLVTKISVPKIILAPSKPFTIQEANLSMDMSVSAHSEDSLAVKSDTEVEGSASVGFGIFKGSMRIKAAVSVAKDQKRSSDYTSTTHVDVKMAQGEAPEGLMKIIDALNMTTVKGLALNAELIDRQYQLLVAEAEQPAEASA